MQHMTYLDAFSSQHRKQRDLISFPKGSRNWKMILNGVASLTWIEPWWCFCSFSKLICFKGYTIGKIVRVFFVCATGASNQRQLMPRVSTFVSTWLTCPIIKQIIHGEYKQCISTIYLPVLHAFLIYPHMYQSTTLYFTAKHFTIMGPRSTHPCRWLIRLD